MIEILHTTLAFILAIALLIAVHEYGHFIVARKLGIKVEKFSIGFGPALFSWRSRDGEVLYIIAAIPLGGYVKMLGENADEQGEAAKSGLSEEDKARAFDVQPVWKRACVAVAGPGFNFIFAVFAYMLVAWLGQSVLPTIVGHVAPASVAEQAGMQQGDRILAVQKRDVHSWQQMEELLKKRAGQSARITVKRDEQDIVLQLDVPQPEKDPLLLDVANELLGFNPGLVVKVDDVVASSPADKAGLQSGDVIRKVNGEAVSNIRQFIEQVKANAGQTVAIVVKRGQTLLALNVVPGVDGSKQVRIGVRLASQTVHSTELFRLGLWDGMAYGFTRTWEMTGLTLQVFGKMVTAAISPDNLGGPIAIAQLAGKTAELGLVYFLSFLALISVNLGVLNLLPIPILDGGLLVYLGLEKLRGKPLSSKMLEISQMAGLSLIIALMVFAFYNDLSRLFRG
jgi:regulator of sigma E protease